jgi:hypothetical protein
MNRRRDGFQGLPQATDSVAATDTGAVTRTPRFTRPERPQLPQTQNFPQNDFRVTPRRPDTTPGLGQPFTRPSTSFGTNPGGLGRNPFGSPGAARSFGQSTADTARTFRSQPHGGFGGMSAFGRSRFEENVVVTPRSSGGGGGNHGGGGHGRRR